MTEPEVTPRGRPADASTTSVYVWGQHRSEVNLAAKVVARRLDPSYAWVEAASTDRPGTGAAAASGAPTVYRPEVLRPLAAIPREVVRSYLRPRGDEWAERELLPFLELPDPVQAATLELVGRPGPRVLVIANVDLLSPSEPEGRGLYGPFVEYFNAQGITLVVTSGSRASADRARFEYSVTPSSSLPARFRSEAAVCQWGDCDACIVPGFPRNELVCLGELATGVPLTERFGIPPPRMTAH